MTRPTVLIVDSDPRRRHALSYGLAEQRYEVVPTVGAAEGVRFAEGLGPAVIVVSADAVREAGDDLLSHLEQHARGEMKTVVLLGEHLEKEEALSEHVVFLESWGHSQSEIDAKLRLILLAREVGADADAEQRALVGDLGLLPPLELVRALSHASITGVVELESGQLVLRDGQPVAARLGYATGIKAFCRLSRLSEGPFRVLLQEVEGEGDLEPNLNRLVIRAIEDSLGDFPDPRTRFDMDVGPKLFSRPYTPLQRLILQVANNGATLQEILDAIPDTDGDIVQELFRLEDLGVLDRIPPVTPVHIVTDSTADLPAELALQLGIQVIPLTVHFGDESFEDRVDLQPGHFYQLLRERSEHPHSQPPPADRFAALYMDWMKESEIVSLHISRAMSDTLANAEKARKWAMQHREDSEDELSEIESPEPPRLVDSRLVSVGLGLLAVFAARMAARERPAEEIVSRLEEMRDRAQMLFVVDTLEYLAKGGRIGRAQAILGQWLGIKPILGLRDGEVAPVDRVRGGRAAHRRILSLMGETLDPQRPIITFIGHAKAPVWADRLRQLVSQEFNVAELSVLEIGPVVGTHAGPGTVGLVYFQPTDEELELLAPLD